MSEHTEPMTHSVYRFNDFTLDCTSRELFSAGRRVELPLSAFDCLRYLVENRERPVGRDELISAVWGKVEVGQSLVAHTIVLLRKTLGDTRAQQHSIRTVTGLGYRWVAETTGVARSGRDPEHATALGEPASSPTEADSAATLPATRSWTKRLKWTAGVSAAGILIALLVVTVLLPSHRRVNAARDAPLTMVLPTVVNAGSDWMWLQFGLMDLVSRQLSTGGVKTIPSETVVALVQSLGGSAQDRAKIAAARAGAGLILQPTAIQSGGTWMVRLDIVGDGPSVHLEGSDQDVVVATRTVTDTLLIRLGKAPHLASDMQASDKLRQALQQIRAAGLANQAGLARALIQRAAAEFPRQPELALSEINLNMDAALYPEAQKALKVLLASLPPNAPPAVVADAWCKLGRTLLETGDKVAAREAYDKALASAPADQYPQLAADAYSGLGSLALRSSKIDEAQTYFARARSLYESVGAMYDVARSDMNLGIVAGQRGQSNIAITAFTGAADRLQRLGAVSMLTTALMNLSTAQAHAARYADALATTDRFWPPDNSERSKSTLWRMTLMRASALVDVGRITEAQTLASKLVGDADLAARQSNVLAAAQVIVAHVDLIRNDEASGDALAAEAIRHLSDNYNWELSAEAWNYRIAFAQLKRDVSEAGKRVAAMEAWAVSLDREGALVLAEGHRASQLALEGNQAAAEASFSSAIERAEKLGEPKIIQSVAVPYIELLLAMGRLDRASTVGGKIAQWADQDWLVAWSQSRIFAALGREGASMRWLAVARTLAGERPLPARTDFTPLVAEH